MNLTLGQKIQIGLGALALLRKHAALVPQLRVVVNDVIDLWDSVVPPEKPVASDIRRTVEDHLTPEEQQQFDRASNPNAGGS